MAVKEETTTSKMSDAAAQFQVNVRLVLARVVVRDASGHTIGNLRKEDFAIFDNGKPQVVSNFDVEHVGVQASASPAVATAAPTDTSKPPEPPPALPARSVAYLFDDLHLTFENINLFRVAAQHRLDALPSTDRVALFSTSGQITIDFTDDRAKLHQALENLQPGPRFGGEITKCPDISFYMADLIVNKNDPSAMETALNDYINCHSGGGGGGVEFIRGVATGVLNAGQLDSRQAIGVLKNAVRRLVAMPGQRSLILVSPGLLTPQLEYDYNDIIDRALRGRVVISSLDARGLYVMIPFGEASQHGVPDKAAGALVAPASRSYMDMQAASAQSEIMAVLAYSTGGTFFHNNNDMDEGLRRVADAPEWSYVLGFNPQNLKPDGKFHTLKVRVKLHEKYDVQARRGYYAPTHTVGQAEEAKREIEDEVLSSEELHDLPVALRTQFFKVSDDTAKLTVLADVDVKHLHYKQADNRNQNELTVVTALFDRNGNILQSEQKLVTMRWEDETLQNKLASGITLRSSFDVKPGRYLVRVVARDTQQQLMAAENGAVEIPATPVTALVSLPGHVEKEPVSNPLVPSTDNRALPNNPAIEYNPWANARPYLDDPLPKLHATLPELKGLDPAGNQEQLTYILDRAGDKCVDLLRRIPNIISREEVISLVPEPPPLMAGSLEPYVGIQRERFDYLLLSEHTASGIKLEEYRMVHGRPATAPLALGQLSQGFTSEWLRLYPGNRSEARFRYLGEQIVDRHKTFVLGFAQIPQSVRFPTRFQLSEKEIAIFLQGVVWIDSTDFRIVRMREDLLAPRPDIGLKKFTTTIRFGEVNIAKAASSLWLPQEVVIEWEFQGQTIQRRHRYSDYRLYVAKARILPAAP